MHSCTFEESRTPNDLINEKDKNIETELIGIELEKGSDGKCSPLDVTEEEDCGDNEEDDEIFEEEFRVKNIYNDDFVNKQGNQTIQDRHSHSFIDQRMEKCKSLMASRKRPFQLSFGIDRILNQEDSGSHNKQLLLEMDICNSENVSLQVSCNMSSSPSSTLISCSPRRSSSPVSMGTPRVGSADLLLTSNFHSPFVQPEVCRMDSASLDLLPMRSMWPDVFVCPWTGMQRDRFGLVRRVGHPYQNRTPPKRKKPRTAFTRQQVLELEKRFTRQKYLASAERSALAKTLSMTDAQVKTWFQNRRTKWRRQTAEERDIERQAAHKFLLSLRAEETPRPIGFNNLCALTQASTLARTDESSIASS